MLNLELSDALYLRFRDLLLSRCGLDYPPSRRSDLLHSLRLALCATGSTDLEMLYAQAVANEQVWDVLISHITIGETYFFRNTPQFDALREHILPELFARRAALPGLRCWSAGCATGEEPYSLAMLLCDLLPDHDAWHLSILATDINRMFLARAQAGLYSAWSFRETPPATRLRYFTPEGERWRLDSRIRRMVRFMPLNLAEPSYPAIVNGTCALDLILCRNVTIYFDAATTRQVVARLYHALAPGGWLIVGHAEPQMSVYQQFEVHNFPDTIVYRKPLNAPLFAFDAERGTFTAGAAPVISPSLSTPSAPPSSQPVPNVLLRASVATPACVQTASTPAEPLTPALIKCARQCADRGDWAAAEQYCARALERDPLCRDAHYLLAQIHEHQGQLDAALTEYRRTVYLDQHFVLGILGMGQVWRALGRIADAQRAYRNALKQLTTLSAAAAVPGADDLTYGDLAVLARQQLQALGAAE
jgi:chemotaxis protein methyltransferase CheR